MVAVGENDHLNLGRIDELLDIPQCRSSHHARINQNGPLIQDQIDIAVEGSTANLMHFHHEINTSESKAALTIYLLVSNDADARG